MQLHRKSRGHTGSWRNVLRRQGKLTETFATARIVDWTWQKVQRLYKTYSQGPTLAWNIDRRFKDLRIVNGSWRNVGRGIVSQLFICHGTIRQLSWPFCVSMEHSLNSLLSHRIFVNFRQLYVHPLDVPSTFCASTKPSTNFRQHFVCPWDFPKKVRAAAALPSIFCAITELL